MHGLRFCDIRIRNHESDQNQHVIKCEASQSESALKELIRHYDVQVRFAVLMTGQITDDDMHVYAPQLRYGRHFITTDC